MTLFANNFWGEKNNGFDILYHIMKDGSVSSKEFEDFLRESCTVEEQYIRLQGKLARSVSNYGNRGSFGPFFQVLKTLPEKLGTLHQQLMTSWQELIREVHKYSIEQLKKQRVVKDEEAATQESMICVQQTIVALNKAKENYHARCMEYEKLKRESATLKELERAETKLKKANDEYKSLVEKYANVRNEFQTHMLGACKKFQEIEEKHLMQMKEFVKTYAKALENNNALLGQVHEEFAVTGQNLTIEKLLEMLIHSKGTGTDPPGPLEFVEADLSTLSMSTPVAAILDIDKKDTSLKDPSKREAAVNPDSTSHSSAESTNKTATSIIDRTLPASLHAPNWRIFPRGKKKKNTKKSGEETGTGETAEKNTPQVDDEGFTIRTDPTTQHNNRDSSNSSSDSDSDGDEKPTKIKVAIRPITENGTAGSGFGGTLEDNTKYIRDQMSGIRLSPVSAGSRRTPVSGMDGSNGKHSGSSRSTGKASDDLIDLDIFGPSPPPGPPPPSTAIIGVATASPSLLNNGEHKGPSPALNVSTGIIPLLPSSSDDLASRLRSQGVVTPLIPAPKISKPNTAYPPRPYRSQTPDFKNMERADSTASLSNLTFSSSTSIGSSRGPSPMTISMSDNIPLAVAFSEYVNAYFKGSDESKCRVKLTGDLQMSFPASIVCFLVDNPSPVPLVFRLKNVSSLEQILVNPKLIAEDSKQSTGDCKVYQFDMVSLGEHLRGQTELNRSASYFNIDILKYQIRSRPGFQSVPLQLVSFWKCTEETTDFRLDYSYNSEAVTSCKSPPTLSNVSVLVTVDGAVTQMQSLPDGNWSSDTKRGTWKLGEITSAETNCRGSVRAKFDLAAGPSTPSLVAVQFLGDGTTLSGVDFELGGPGYRISLMKKRFLTGKYISECDSSRCD